ncbi:MAG: sigma-70 family RNA polymerase sigma factor, partial [Candidatus Omnitrophica bacterium]|nr:sigma-70 family RNA polymerase sigma factor [Candidatus Omnitrophota bacterium]
MGEESINFDELVLEHKDKVFNLCYRFLGNYEEVDDCAQETFVKVYRSLKGFRRESSVSTWIYRIAVNTCKNRVASAQYRRSRNMVRLD